MTAKQCADNWKRIVQIYKETRDTTPSNTINLIVAELGKADTYTVFATVAEIKRHDGRIYGRNRTRMNEEPFIPEAVKREYGNPMIYAGLDDIHTAHINQLIGALIDLD